MIVIIIIYASAAAAVAVVAVKQCGYYIQYCACVCGTTLSWLGNNAKRCIRYIFCRHTFVCVLLSTVKINVFVYIHKRSVLVFTLFSIRFSSRSKYIRKFFEWSWVMFLRTGMQWLRKRRRKKEKKQPNRFKVFSLIFWVKLYWFTLCAKLFLLYFAFGAGFTEGAKRSAKNRNKIKKTNDKVTSRCRSWYVCSFFCARAKDQMSIVKLKLIEGETWSDRFRLQLTTNYHFLSS